jgi:mono/diheme cytochrome c family protein
MKKWIILSALIAIIVVFSAFIKWLDKPVVIPGTKQRIGNSAEGYKYLINGDYVKSGLPYNLFRLTAGKTENDYLQREGINKNVPFQYTAVTAANGEIVVAPNCLQCHAQVFNDQLIIGLGNNAIDFTQQPKLNTKNFDLLEKMLKAGNPKQYEASIAFITATKALMPYLYTITPGVNTADRIAALLVAHRDPVTFKWNDNVQLEIPEEVIPTDTPPWWLLKKKNGMFYNGFGRGDFGRFLMASNLLTVNDTTESGIVDSHMPDVLAYIYSIQPPKFPKPIDKKLSSKGNILFNQYCSSCHGTYGKKETYPNLLIPENMVGTDSMLIKSNYSNPQFVNWFNKSWFTKGDHPASLQPYNGYIAPPLDGVWITAPYLHNGSVPTLEALLNSKLRPRYWSRDFQHPVYDYDKIGWVYKNFEQPEKNIYNTDIRGYGNYGHTYGDDLSEDERKAVIEYLKTL